jgi:hypothetical protein
VDGLLRINEQMTGGLGAIPTEKVNSLIKYLMINPVPAYGGILRKNQRILNIIER